MYDPHVLAWSKNKLCVCARERGGTGPAIRRVAPQCLFRLSHIACNYCISHCSLQQSRVKEEREGGDGKTRDKPEFERVRDGREREKRRKKERGRVRVWQASGSQTL